MVNEGWVWITISIMAACLLRTKYHMETSFKYRFGVNEVLKKHHEKKVFIWTSAGLIVGGLGWWLT